MSRFAAWEARNLAKFAQEATTRLLEQEELIESLQADLKTAIRAYRHLVIEGANREQNNTVDSSRTP
jgi:DNA-binding transcriptional MocR family regulator